MEYNFTKAEYSRIIDFVKPGNILLYGKGDIGQLFLHWLAIQGLDGLVHGFAVTSMDGSFVCRNKPVFAVEQVAAMRPVPRVVICTNRYRQEMQQALAQAGFTGEQLLLTDLDVRRMELKRQRQKLKFQVHLAEHCNLNCRGCFHCSPLAEPELLSVEEYERDARRLSELFGGQLDSLELLGGEPLLHPQVKEFFRISRDCFPTGRIQLLTNGVLLKQMKEDFWQAMHDYDIVLACTEYPLNVDYRAIEAKAKEHGVRYMNFVLMRDEQGRKVLEHYHFDPKGGHDFRENFYRCYRSNFCIYLLHGHLYSCVLGGNLHHLKRYFHCDGMDLNEAANSIDIHKAGSAEEISRFMLRAMPLCAYCNLHDEKTIIHFERTRYELSEWT